MELFRPGSRAGCFVHVEALLSQGSSQAHQNCFVCGDQNGCGLGVRFELQDDGSVIGSFWCDPRFQGFADRLHGGVIGMLLDDAMTNCLLKQGIQAVTGRMDVRYREPVALGAYAEVYGCVESAAGAIYKTRGELRQNGRVMAVADAKFLDLCQSEEDSAFRLVQRAAGGDRRAGRAEP